MIISKAGKLYLCYLKCRSIFEQESWEFDIGTTRTFSCECKMHLVLFKIMIGASDNSNLLAATLGAHGFNRNLVRCIYSYLEKRKECVRINSATCISVASSHNFPDDNRLFSGGREATVEDLIELL